MTTETTTTRVLIINGPNLNRLGKRQPEVYGSTTLDDVEKMLRDKAQSLGLEVDFFQSNHEGELVEKIHAAADAGDAVVINPGAFTHTSVALRDALTEIAEGQGFIEVHISNIHAREEFRQHSFLSDIALGLIAGLGIYGYSAALEYFA